MLGACADLAIFERVGSESWLYHNRKVLIPRFSGCCAEVIHCRVNQVSLVCKSWNNVEREHAHRPVQLHLKPRDFTSARVTWHMRDTSRLEEVKVLDNRRIYCGNGYWWGLEKLLKHLSDKAPALRSLELEPPRPATFYEGDSESRFNFLTLVGALSQLESLVLRDWKYFTPDLHWLTELSRLQNLKVLHSPQNIGAFESHSGPCFADAPNLSSVCQSALVARFIYDCHLMHAEFVAEV
jgi:hypothetical protein